MDVVDDDDRVIGSAPEKEAGEGGRIHMGAFMTMGELEHKMMQEKFTPETIRLYEIARDFLWIADYISEQAKKNKANASGDRAL